MQLVFFFYRRSCNCSQILSINSYFLFFILLDYLRTNHYSKVFFFLEKNITFKLEPRYPHKKYGGNIFLQKILHLPCHHNCMIRYWCGNFSSLTNQSYYLMCQVHKTSFSQTGGLHTLQIRVSISCTWRMTDFSCKLMLCHFTKYLSWCQLYPLKIKIYIVLIFP